MMHHDDRQISNWLLLVCVAILIMLMIGGATRLTHSSLSMVEWDSVLGWVLPSSQEEWQLSFKKYQQSPAFEEHPAEPSLEDFKHLFMLEYIHWMWGSLIVLLFMVPYISFLKRGCISSSLHPKLMLILLLGGIQGLVSWYMVKVGLVNHPYASQYRLSVHLLSAFCIFGYILWVAMGLRYPDWCSRNRSFFLLRVFTLWFTAWLLVTVLSGGLVAGLQVGTSFGQLVVAQGQWVPQNYFLLQPWYVNVFQNTVTVLFDHGVMAFLTGIFVLFLWLFASQLDLSWRAKSAYHMLLLITVLQLGLGMMTVWMDVPIFLAVMHHVCAVLLFSVSVLCNHALRFTDRLC